VILKFNGVIIRVEGEDFVSSETRSGMVLQGSDLCPPKLILYPLKYGVHCYLSSVVELDISSVLIPHKGFKFCV